MPLFKKLFRNKKSKGLLDQLPDELTSSGNLGKVFKELDCPVCFNTCVPPIHSCTNGHIICNNCRENVRQCPSCRHGFSGTRNFFAENFVSNCSQTCRYGSEGCEFLRLKGDDMKPHEDKCMFRPITCLIPTCGEQIPYKSVLSHLTFDHKICGSDKLPATITFHADQPIINNRKWLPFAIEAHGNVFYVMMEVIRPHFWVWLWLQTIKIEDLYESLFTSSIMITNSEKKLKLMWEGPVQSVRTSDKEIMRDGLCFVAHEVFLQHFNSNGYFTFQVDIKKSPRTNAQDLNANTVIEKTTTETTIHLRRRSRSERQLSEQSLYDTIAILRETEMLEESHPNNPNLSDTEEELDHFESFVSKSSAR